MKRKIYRYILLLPLIIIILCAAPATIINPSLDSNISISEQDDVVLMCTARGFPTPVISWNYETMSDSDERITVTSLTPVYMDSSGLFTVESTLIISQSTRHSSGRYSCRATNTITGSVRMDLKVYEITVKCKHINDLCNFNLGHHNCSTVAATLYETPMNVTVLVPDAAVLRCQADGEPVPDITWIRELNNGSSVELTPKGNVMITKQVDRLNRTSLLTIQPTSIQDSGNYRCRAQNELNSTELSNNIHITIYGKLSIL